MKKTVLAFLLALLLVLSSCGSDRSQIGENPGTDSGDLVESTNDNTVDTTPVETEKAPENEKKTVICREEYTKEIDKKFQNTDFPETHHKIRIPKLTLESENATKFSLEIYWMHGSEPIFILDEYDECETIYNIDYIFEEYKGIIGIMIKDYSSDIASYRSENYYGYYYDTINDRALDFYEYLDALDVDYYELVEAANGSISAYCHDEFYDPEESYKLKGNLSDYELTAAIFSENRGYVSVPLSDYGKILAEYDRKFVGQSEKRYYVSVEDKLEIYYNTYKDLLNSSPKGDIKDAFIVDYNKDGTPELAIDYTASYGGDYIEISGIGDNDFHYSFESPYGMGNSSDYGVLLYEGKVGLMEIEYDSPGYYYMGDTYITVYRHGCGEGVFHCNIIYEPTNNYYAYRFNEYTDYTVCSKKECSELVDKFQNILETYKLSGETHGFRGPWELQKSK